MSKKKKPQFGTLTEAQKRVWSAPSKSSIEAAQIALNEQRSKRIPTQINRLPEHIPVRPICELLVELNASNGKIEGIRPTGSELAELAGRAQALIVTRTRQINDAVKEAEDRRARDAKLAVFQRMGTEELADWARDLLEIVALATTVCRKSGGELPDVATIRVLAERRLLALGQPREPVEPTGFVAGKGLFRNEQPA